MGQYIYLVIYRTNTGISRKVQLYLGELHPILDTRISGLPPPFVMLRGPPLDSEMAWTGELWLVSVVLILKNNRIKLFFLMFLE